MNPHLRQSGANARLLPRRVVHRLDRTAPVQKDKLRMLAAHAFDHVPCHPFQENLSLVSPFLTLWPGIKNTVVSSSSETVDGAALRVAVAALAD